MAGHKMSNLTERELLVLLIEKVDRLEQDVAMNRAVSDRIAALEMRLMEQEVKMRLWGGIIGFVAGLGGSFITKLLHF